jgi:RNase P protein component
MPFQLVVFASAVEAALLSEQIFIPFVIFLARRNSAHLRIAITLAEKHYGVATHRNAFCVVILGSAV